MISYMEKQHTTRCGCPYACIYGHLVNPMVSTRRCKQSSFTCFCKSDINQTVTNGGGMISGVRSWGLQFLQKSDLVEELIAFLSILGPQKFEILTIGLDTNINWIEKKMNWIQVLSKPISIQWEGISVLASQVSWIGIIVYVIHPIHRFESSDWLKEGHMTWISFDNVHVRKLIHVC